MGETVKVIVRCRPMNQREKDLSCSCVIDMVSSNNQVSIRNPDDDKVEPKSFFFDGVYFVDGTTESIYSDVGYSLVDSTCEGYNGTIFAYGQTGCGKSFSMQGITNPQSQKGIIPRAFEHIFETASVENSKFLIHCSYLEIYNEEIRDLLGKDVKQKLDLKEHPQKGVYVAGLTLHKVAGVKQCEAIMQRGWDNRTTGSTLMNADSSRSHSIFTIVIERADTAESGKETIRAGKLNLVDLAGSERQAKTGATGDRLKEATKINLSLSALGNVISALVDGKSTHIPYRDSKLTRMLQDSLGGNTKTLMVACISPADNNYDESLSTLRYANRAKNIKNKPKVNEDPKDTMIRQYQSQIAQLKAMLLGEVPVDPGLLAALGIAGNVQLPTGTGTGTQASAGRSPQHKAVRDLEAEKTKIEEERARLHEEYEQRLADAQRLYESERVDKERLNQEIENLRSRYDQKMERLDLAENRVEKQLNDQEEMGRAAVSVDRDRPSEVAKRDYSEDNDRVASDESGQETAYTDDFVVIDDQANFVPAAVAVASSAEAVNTDSSASAARHAEAFKSSHSSASEQQYFDDPSKLEALIERLAQNRSSLDSRTVQMLEKLETLKNGVVGGELANSDEAKAVVEKKRRFANAKKQKLAELNENMNAEDEGIMVNIFQNTEDRLKRAIKLLQERKRENKQLKDEAEDIQREFERERSDYLETIRRQEREILLLTTLIDKMHPLIRRDCNYSHIDSVKQQSRFDEARNIWIVPDVLLERSHLPGASALRKDGSRATTYGDEGTSQYYSTQDSPRQDDDEYEQRLNERMRQNGDPTAYFKSKRRDKLLNNQSQHQLTSMPERLRTSGSSSAHMRRDTDEYRGDYQQSYSSGNLNDEDSQPGLSGSSPVPLRKPVHLAPLAPKSARRRRQQPDD